MTHSVFVMLGAALFVLGLFGVFAQIHLLRRIIAANLATSGVFLLLIGMAPEQPGEGADPVAQALVLTGIVISVSLTAFALVLLRRLVELTGSAAMDAGES